MYKIEKENLEALFRKIAESQDLILPVKKAGQTNFGLWNEGEEADLETLKTVKSGKDAFFPQSETLYTCVRDGKKLTVEPEELRSRPFVVFGMKACDVKGVAVLDKVFLADPVDTFYAARRDHGTIVAMACHEPEESCFCKVFGTDAADPEADADGKGIADVAAWMVEGSLYWKALTEKGEALTEAVKELLSREQVSCEDISYYLLHQANERIIRSAARRLGEDISRFPMNMDRYGNTSSASLLILLDEVKRSGELQRGDKLVLAGFGGGLTYGASLIEY